MSLVFLGARAAFLNAVLCLVLETSDDFHE
jgi:hypothetical protein